MLADKFVLTKPASESIAAEDSLKSSLQRQMRMKLHFEDAIVKRFKDSVANGSFETAIEARILH